MISPTSASESSLSLAVCAPVPVVAVAAAAAVVGGGSNDAEDEAGAAGRAFFSRGATDFGSPVLDVRDGGMRVTPDEVKSCEKGVLISRPT